MKIWWVADWKAAAGALVVFLPSFYLIQQQWSWRLTTTGRRQNKFAQPNIAYVSEDNNNNNCEATENENWNDDDVEEKQKEEEIQCIQNTNIK